jgi:hypothetical protein
MQLEMKAPRDDWRISSISSQVRTGIEMDFISTSVRRPNLSAVQRRFFPPRGIRNSLPPPILTRQAGKAGCSTV